MASELLNLVKPSYWLTFDAPSVSGWLGIAVFVFFLLFVVVGIVVKVFGNQKNRDRYYKEISKHISSLLVTMGAIGAVLFFFSFESIRFFGARFWYLIWIIVVILWVLWIVRFIKKYIPTMKKQDLDRREKNKYLPNTKRRKR